MGFKCNSRKKALISVLIFVVAILLIMDSLIISEEFQISQKEPHIILISPESSLEQLSDIELAPESQSDSTSLQLIFQENSEGLLKFYAATDFNITINFSFFNMNSFVSLEEFQCNFPIMRDSPNLSDTPIRWTKPLVETQKSITQNKDMKWDLVYQCAGTLYIAKSGSYSLKTEALFNEILIQSNIVPIEIIGSTLAVPSNSYITLRDYESVNDEYTLDKKIDKVWFLLHLLDHHGNPISKKEEGVYDHFNIIIRGPRTMHVIPKIINSFQYEFSVNMSIPGTYTVEAFLNQPSFHVETHESESCYHNYADSLVKPKLTIVSTFENSGDLTKVPDCRFPADQEFMTQGGYINNPKLFPTIDKDSFPIWTGYKCHVKHFMKKQINKCLSGKWIGLIGDSVMKDFAQILVEKQGWIVNETTMAPYYAQKTVYRYFDTIFDSSIDIGARISFMWNGAPAPQGNGYGLYSYEAEEYVQRTKLFFNHRCSTCQNDDPNKPFPTSEEGHKPDIMVVNSGLHDLYNLVNVLEFHFDIYEEKLRKFLMFVQPLAHKIIWKATSPKVSYFICTGNQIPNNGDAAVDVLNQIARRVVAEFPSIDYFDSNTIQKSRPEDSDGHHCKENPSCQEGFHVFMNMICPQNE